ncbi:hypothetical protein DAI22_05g090401 [Oryza sativa Japonica Group]|nr:hypothetical protein DAI22_05g090401 [Oryza sativa Japonica Group]
MMRWTIIVYAPAMPNATRYSFCYQLEGSDVHQFHQILTCAVQVFLVNRLICYVMRSGQTAYGAVHMMFSSVCKSSWLPKLVGRGSNAQIHLNCSCF